MNIDVLSKKDITETMDLFCRSFFDDHYYAELFPDPNTKVKDMTEAFKIHYYIVSPQEQALALKIKEN